MGFGSIGTGELLIIFLIALLIFGPARLADLGRSLGQAIRDFRRSLQGEDPEDSPDSR